MKGFFKVLYFFTLIFISVFAFCQKDTLNSELKNYLFERINSNDLENNPILDYNKSDSISIERDSLFNPRFYYLLGKINSEKGNYRIAIQYLNTAENYFDRNNPHLFFVKVFLEKANCFNKIRNIEYTKDNYEEALLLSQQLEDKIASSICHNNLGLIDIQEQKLDLAKAHFERSFELRKQVGDPFLLANSLRHLGKYKFHNKEYRKSIKLFDEAAKMYLSLEGTNKDLIGQEISNCYNDLGFAYIKIGELRKAKENALKAVSILIDDKDQKSKLQIEFQSANVLYYSNYFNESIEIAKRIALTAKEDQDLNLLLSCFQLLTDCNEKLGKYDAGIQYARKSQQVKEQIQESQINKKLANERFSYQSMSNKKLMAMIEKENALKSTEIEAQEKVTQLLFLLILISFLGIISLFYSNHQKVKINNKLTRKHILIENQNIEIKKQQNALKTAKSELEDKIRELEILTDEKSHLMSIVAHDLRTPLNSIIGLVELLKMEDTEEAKNQYLNLIVESGNRMLGMINTLLNIKKIEAQKIEVNFDNVNINKVLKKILKDFDTWIKNKQIEIEIIDIEIIHSVYADENLLHQVLENLLSNAIKYSPVKSKIQIKGSSALNTYSISFIDQGPGISEADQQKMFSKYQRLSARPTAGEDSMGIGLSLVKKLVSLMNCKIFVSSKLGKGSTFSVILNTTKQL